MEMDYPTKLEDLVKDNYGQPLICSGCAHSSGYSEFPGAPSGERPCHFCIRNVQREEWQKAQIEKFGEELKVWYDGSKIVSYPMDCYHSCDMKEQIDIWISESKEENID